jgi:mRNA interferase YafQ
VFSILEQEANPDEKYKDHELIGNWSNFRECPIKPELLLIYKKTISELKFARIGNHSNLF